MMGAVQGTHFCCRLRVRGLGRGVTDHNKDKQRIVEWAKCGRVGELAAVCYEASRKIFLVLNNLGLVHE